MRKKGVGGEQTGREVGCADQEEREVDTDSTDGRRGAPDWWWSREGSGSLCAEIET